MTEDQSQKPTLRLMNHHSLNDAVAFIEAMSGEKMTPEEAEELRQALKLPSGSISGPVTGSR